MGDKTICTCGQGYDPECPWEGHHQPEPVKRYTVQPAHDNGIGEIEDYAGRYVHFADYDRDIKALKLTLFQTAESYKVIVGERDATIIRLQELLRRERYEVLHDRGCDCDLCVAVDAALKESS